ncbi:MAG: hypothetical protein IPL35_02005 [Sphingobacteriales bacterium]|nr:hypothetical protein [Sphingobacteriales bacterium]
MKLVTLIITLLFSTLCFSQKITSDNYYDFYYDVYSNIENLKGVRLVTAWLNKIEASQILVEEMKNAGFESIDAFSIVKVSENEYVLAICFSEESKIGFVYESVHGGTPEKQNRKLKSLSKGYDYMEIIDDLNGDSYAVRIKVLPENLQIIKEDIYWYQYTDNPDDDQYLVTKKDMISIFRDDIKKQISKFKK